MSLSALGSQRKTHTEHFLHSDFHYDFGKCLSPLRPLTEQKCVVFTHSLLAAYLSVWQLKETLTHEVCAN